jgi:hypothetical protein
MSVRDENRIQIRSGNTGRYQPLTARFTGIDKDPRLAALHQTGRAETSANRRPGSRAEKKQ